MKKVLFGLLFIASAAIFQNAKAQSAPQTVIGSAGDFATFTNGSISWTIGEAVTDTYAPTGYFLTQGFHQPDTMFLTVVSEPASKNIAVYPNPVAGNLTIDLLPSGGNYKTEIFDMQGQLLRRESIPADQKQFSISFQEFANGVYFLNILNTETQAKNSYKISKTK